MEFQEDLHCAFCRVEKSVSQLQNVGAEVIRLINEKRFVSAHGLICDTCLPKLNAKLRKRARDRQRTQADGSGESSSTISSLGDSILSGMYEMCANINSKLLIFLSTFFQTF